MSVNLHIVLGRLGKDPELAYTPAGDAVCKFSVATGEKFKDNTGEMKERTDWHNVVVWRKLAEICNQYLKKGQQVYIEGKSRTRSWEDKDGKKCYMTEIIADKVQFLGRKEGSGQQGQEGTGTGSGDPGFQADDIPF